MKQGKLYYNNDTKRYSFYYIDEGLKRDYNGIHCGECLEVKSNNTWVQTRMEKSNKWYLVGVPGLELEGVEVRI